MGSIPIQVTLKTGPCHLVAWPSVLVVGLGRWVEGSVGELESRCCPLSSIAAMQKARCSRWATDVAAGSKKAGSLRPTPSWLSCDWVGRLPWLKSWSTSPLAAHYSPGRSRTTFRKTLSSGEKQRQKQSFHFDQAPKSWPLLPQLHNVVLVDQPQTQCNKTHSTLWMSLMQTSQPWRGCWVSSRRPLPLEPLFPPVVTDLL